MAADFEDAKLDINLFCNLCLQKLTFEYFLDGNLWMNL